MTKFLISAALFALSATAPALAKDVTTFTHQGVKYSYSVKQLSDTKRVITGFATPGSAFRLVVSGDKVSGTSNGMPVDFKVSDAKGMASTAEKPVTVASR